MREKIIQSRCYWVLPYQVDARIEEHLIRGHPAPKGRPSSPSRGAKGTSLVTASIGYTRSLVHQYVYPRVICQSIQMSNGCEILTLGGNASSTDERCEDTNDGGYSANPIAEQCSIIGLDIEARYTRTFIEWCIRNYNNNKHG
jgi:hypothetical protein